MTIGVGWPKAASEFAGDAMAGVAIVAVAAASNHHVLVDLPTSVAAVPQAAAAVPQAAAVVPQAAAVVKENKDS
jgi:hypothetical protein